MNGLIVISLFFTACGSAPEEKEPVSQPAPQKDAPRSNFSEEGTAKVMRLLSDYYALKDGLVASDAAEAKEAAVNIQVSADSMEHFLGDSTHILYAHIKAIKQQAGNIVVINDASTERQRIPFEKLSDAMYALVKDANLKNAGIFRQYCPMAFNDKGAYWLSSEEKIRNPYFGKKMLTCGEVTDILK